MIPNNSLTQIDNEEQYRTQVAENWVHLAPSGYNQQPGVPGSPPIPRDNMLMSVPQWSDTGGIPIPPMDMSESSDLPHLCAAEPSCPGYVLSEYFALSFIMYGLFSCPDRYWKALWRLEGSPILPPPPRLQPIPVMDAGPKMQAQHNMQTRIK